jgi:hypothetical protein
MDELQLITLYDNGALVRCPCGIEFIIIYDIEKTCSCGKVWTVVDDKEEDFPEIPKEYVPGDIPEEIIPEETPIIPEETTEIIPEDIPEEIIPEETEILPEKTTQKEVEEAPMKICTFCGIMHNNNVIDCEYCGNKEFSKEKCIYCGKTHPPSFECMLQ